MTQNERRIYLIKKLQKENPTANIPMPPGEPEQKRLLRALFNVRPPKAADSEFLKVQDEYLREELLRKGVTDAEKLNPIKPDVYLWQGDITTLKCDAIVNAANRQMLGCFCPNHGCIDNAIHTFSGIALRLECQKIMKAQGHPEKTGGAKITPAFNLPSRYVIHTVGPIVKGRLTETDCALLKSCYRSCLKVADENRLKSIAFPCISTGEFHFPNERAAEIAVNTVMQYKKETNRPLKVIFNVFKEIDNEIYQRLLK